MADGGLLPELPVQVSRPRAMQYVYVDYGEVAEPWHERLALLPMDGQRAVVLTPDYDVYDEVLDVPPMRNVIFHGTTRRLPGILGVGVGQPVYRFVDTPARAPLARALREARELQAELGIQVPVVGAAPLAAAGAVTPPGDPEPAPYNCRR